MLADFETFMITDEDHFVPLSKGGEDSADNRVTSCRPCNMLKGDFAPAESLEQLGREAYLLQIREHIARQRVKRIADFDSWLEIGMYLKDE